jgi:hypothetical protein
MTLLQTEPTKLAALFRHLGLIGALAAGLAWGAACAMLRAPYPAVALGGLAAAAAGFWFERGVLITPETRARKDFQLILAAGFGFFAIVGVGLVSLSSLLARWYLPHI